MYMWKYIYTVDILLCGRGQFVFFLFHPLLVAHLLSEGSLYSFSVTLPVFILISEDDISQTTVRLQRFPWSIIQTLVKTIASRYSHISRSITMSCGAISLSHNHARIHHQPVGNGSRLSVPKEQYIWSILLFNISRFFQYNSFIQESLSLTLGYSYIVLHFSRCSSINVNPCQARVRIFTKPARLKHGSKNARVSQPVTARFFLFCYWIPPWAMPVMRRGGAPCALHQSKQKGSIPPNKYSILVNSWVRTC